MKGSSQGDMSLGPCLLVLYINKNQSINENRSIHNHSLLFHSISNTLSVFSLSTEREDDGNWQARTEAFLHYDDAHRGYSGIRATRTIRGTSCIHGERRLLNFEALFLPLRRTQLLLGHMLLYSTCSCRLRRIG